MHSGGIDHGAEQASAASVQRALAEPRCEVWGVLNVTDDSFSDGGRHLEPAAAVAHAQQLMEQGASVLDIGGASSRPAGKAYGAGAGALSADDELARVQPVLEVVRALGIRVSIDTTQAKVARAALAAGAVIVNDVSCAANTELLRAVADADAGYVVMHSRGRGEVAPPNTTYRNVTDEVIAELLLAIDRAVAHGIRRERLWVDPGIGFAKTATQSLLLLARLERLVELGYPVLVGASRKGFIAEVAPFANGERPAPLEREAGSLAVLTASVLKGARAVRVHEVAPARQAVLLAEALIRAGAAQPAGEHAC